MWHAVFIGQKVSPCDIEPNTGHTISTVNILMERWVPHVQLLGYENEKYFSFKNYTKPPIRNHLNLD